MPIINIHELLHKKQLNTSTFSQTELNGKKITFESAMHDHVAWAFRHIYSVPYPNSIIKEDGIARFYHGIQHVGRVTMYIPVWANLYRRHNYQEAIQLTDQELKLTQIAGLFHDSAREDEGVDLWDHESAMLFYFYVTRVLQIDKTQAKLFAEALANKDWYPGDKHYYVFNETQAGSLIVEKEDGDISRERSIAQNLIHDADCLDIIRVRDAFDGRYLDFYKNVVCKETSSSLAFDEMAEMIIKARSLISIQGDSNSKTVSKIKSSYENEQAYAHILKNILNDSYRIFDKLYGKGELLSTQELSNVSLIDTTNILYTHDVLARGLILPSVVEKSRAQKDRRETFARLEFRKISRRAGVLTRTSKQDGLIKHGNPNRSLSLIGSGSSVFTDVGGLIFNYDPNAITAISTVDFNSGAGKKNSVQHLYHRQKFSGIQIPDIYAPILVDLATLKETLKLGGSCRVFCNGIAQHNEIIYRVTHYDAIYFTKEPTFANITFHESPEAIPSAAALKAIYLQHLYSQAFPGKILPIYEYSANHNYLKLTFPFTKSQIYEMWHEVSSDYMLKLVHMGIDISSYPTAAILAMSVYGGFVAEYYLNTLSFDSFANYYPKDLKHAIKRMIEHERKVLSNTYLSYMNPPSVVISNGYTDFIDMEKYRYIRTPSEKDVLTIFKGAIDCYLTKYFITGETNIFNNILMEYLNLDWQYNFTKNDIGFIFSGSNKEIKFRIPKKLSAIDLHKLLRLLEIPQEDYLLEDVVVAEKTAMKLLNLFKTLFKSQSLQAIIPYIIASKDHFEEKYIKIIQATVNDLFKFILKQQSDTADTLLSLLRNVSAQIEGICPDKTWQEHINADVIALEHFSKENKLLLEARPLLTQRVNNLMAQLKENQMLYYADIIFSVEKIKPELESFANKKLINIFKSNKLPLGLIQLSGTTHKPIRGRFYSQTQSLPHLFGLEFVYSKSTDAKAAAEKLESYCRDILDIKELQVISDNPCRILINAREMLEKILPDFKHNVEHLDPQLIAASQVKSKRYLAERNIPSCARLLRGEFTMWSRIYPQSQIKESSLDNANAPVNR